jgi:hypothetical protein
LVQRYTASEDTTKIINEIKKQYAEVNAKVSSYNKVEKKILGQSTESGIIIAYYDNTNLKKIVTTYFGEMGKTVTEYYFNQDGLFFAFKSEYFYNKPIYEEGSKVTSVEENRYYLYKNSLFRWLDNKKKIVRPDTMEYLKENKYFKEDIENFKKILGNFRT